MTYTITLQQLNAAFGLVMPLIVGFVAGVLRQDGFALWLNELISHLVIVLLAATQTLLGGQWGGSSIANFVIVVSIAYGVLSTRFGSEFQGKIQTNTSLLKAPPVPDQAALLAAAITQNLNFSQLAILLRDELLKAGRPIDQQPTQELQIVRASTPPPVQQGG